MSAEEIIGLLAGVALLAYLIYALLRAEEI
ncbi:K(+)-transporting ATPase subunit F [Euzebya tangerina]|nr:K(+)-transporting ATPase subunit F [Euzebya tangerina]